MTLDRIARGPAPSAIRTPMSYRLVATTLDVTL